MARSRRAEATALAGWVKPQLTRLVDEPPERPEWLHEIKFDGYRMHARLDRGAVRLLTRTGLDWTHKYPAIASAVASLPTRQAYLDGELCGVRPDGTTSFSLIQNASDTGNGDALVFFLFDLLHLDGEAISLRPVKERKERLRALLSEVTSPLQFSDHQIGLNVDPEQVVHGAEHASIRSYNQMPEQAETDNEQRDCEGCVTPDSPCHHDRSGERPGEQ